MDTRTQLRDRLRQSRDWAAAIDDLEKELEASGSKPEQSERLFELAALVEDVIPERERALGLYQRAWKLFPDNLKALSRAREVYGEINRLEMVAKLGEMELRSPAASKELAGIVGAALVDSGQKDKAIAVLQRAISQTPDALSVKDALAAVTYDAEFWADQVDTLADEADSKDEATAIRMLVRAARILRMEAPEDERLEQVLKRVLAKDINEPSANFIYETVLAQATRWDELEAHHKRRADRAADHGERVEALRTFGLEWVQRFKDRDRGARFFDAALKATASNGASPMKSVVAAYTLLRQVYGEKGEWNALVDVAEALIAKLPAGEDKLYLAIQAAQIALDKSNDKARARKLMAIAAEIEPRNPSVQDFIGAVGLGDLAEPSAAGSMPMAAQKEEPAAKGGKGKRKKTHAEDSADAAPAAAETHDSGAAAKAAADHAAAEQAAADKAAADHAAAEKASADKAAADKASADKAAAEKASADKAAADKASADKAVADKAAAEKATADKAAAAAAAKQPVSADLDEAMTAARGAEGGNDKGVAAWKDVIAKHPARQEPRRELARILKKNESWAQLADALKDEESKAAAAGADKANVFLELADAYAKLNNDNQVIAALTSAIAQDPSQHAAYDRLAALYESKKRWPDLVKILGEKAERAEATPDKVAIFLQIANLYLERFSNQAEAIKAFEKVLELDNQNQQATDHLLAVYEKRRDWEKLIKLKEAEV
jgi:tetratricopeptide (TPR) repeat protein